ncbi:hypothetical protein HYC85_006362 [Camellia sinensis]|uniref:Uncharacterized protein n=1 Tax=Camellia sinensis TaxID=4442 RepID=A0A7J7HNF4_CAMSI|nr:hypothetical protein HYC85_006362 [Camellia sinensis]
MFPTSLTSRSYHINFYFTHLSAHTCSGGGTFRTHSGSSLIGGTSRSGSSFVGDTLSHTQP